MTVNLDDEINVGWLRTMRQQVADGLTRSRGWTPEEEAKHPRNEDGTFAPKPDEVDASTPQEVFKEKLAAEAAVKKMAFDDPENLDVNRALYWGITPANESHPDFFADAEDLTPAEVLARMENWISQRTMTLGEAKFGQGTMGQVPGTIFADFRHYLELIDDPSRLTLRLGEPTLVDGMPVSDGALVELGHRYYLQSLPDVNVMAEVSWEVMRMAELYPDTAKRVGDIRVGAWNPAWSYESKNPWGWYQDEHTASGSGGIYVNGWWASRASQFRDSLANSAVESTTIGYDGRKEVSAFHPDGTIAAFVSHEWGHAIAAVVGIKPEEWAPDQFLRDTEGKITGSAPYAGGVIEQAHDAYWNDPSVDVGAGPGIDHKNHLSGYGDTKRREWWAELFSTMQHGKSRQSRSKNLKRLYRHVMDYYDELIAEEQRKREARA